MSDTDTRKAFVPALETLGERIALAREAKGMTQPELAALVLSSGRVATISGWERNGAVPDATALAAIAKALDVSADWLLFGGELPVPVEGVSVEPVSDRERILLLGMLSKVQTALAEGTGQPQPAELAGSRFSSALTPDNPIAEQGEDAEWGPEEPRSRAQPRSGPRRLRSPRKRPRTGLSKD